MQPDESWTPVLLVSDSGTWLGVSGRSWVLGRDGRSAVEVDDDPRGLLPLLDRPWAVAREELKDLQTRYPEADDVPLSGMIRLALSNPTSQWAEKAIAWFADGFPARPFIEEIRRVAVEGRTAAQRVRQTAHRLATGL